MGLLILMIIDQPIYNWLTTGNLSLSTLLLTYDYTANEGVIATLWITILLIVAINLIRRIQAKHIHSDKNSTKKKARFDSIKTTNSFLNGVKISIPLFLTAYYFILRANLSGLQLKGFEFTAFQNDTISFLKYLDFIPLLTTFWFFSLIYFLRSRKMLAKKSSVFENDCPIIHSDDDLFNLNTVANELSNEINGWKDTKASFSIGLSGRWGTGKTSLMNLLKNELQYNKANILIDFNAWQYETEINLSIPFLKELQIRLKTFSLTAVKSIDHYIHKILQSNNSFYSKITQPFSTSKSIDELINQIQQDIISSGKRFIVFIDDFDRLQSNEILEILNIIRNVGNLPNTVFVIAYDKEYIISQLSKEKIDRPDVYFNKFIQLEIPLGKIMQDKLQEKLEEGLNSHFKSQFFDPKNQKLIDKDANSLSTIESFPESLVLMDLIDSIRTLKRLLNNLTIQWKLKEGKVEFIDFFILELIRLKYPAEYELLKHERHKMLSEDKEYIFYLREKNKDEGKHIPETSLEKFITFLFPHGEKPRSKKCIRFKRYYDNYFTFDSINDIRDELDQIMYEE